MISDILSLEDVEQDKHIGKANTVVPHKTVLICSAKVAVLRKHRLAKCDSPLECIEIHLMRSNGEKSSSFGENRP